MKVLVTGGAGFLGSHLVELLIKNNHDVQVIDDLSGGTLENIDRNKLKFLWSDCRDAVSMDNIIKAFKPEVVFHLAANAAENKAQFSPIDITSRNYDAFIKVLTPFIKYGGKRFVFTSSIAVYGALQTPFKETDKPEPEDLYGISKLAIEQTLKVMSKVHDFEYVITRPHNVFGPRQNMRDPYRNVVTIWMNSIMQGIPVYIYGDGEQVRQFSYIDDVTEQLYKCGLGKISNTIFNLGSSDTWTVNELCDLLEVVVGKPFARKYLPVRPQEVREAVADHSQTNAYLKKHTSTPLLKGLEKTWEWCKSQGVQTPIYTDIEIPSRLLPENWRNK